MPCNPNDLTLNIPAEPAISTPDLGVPFAPISVDLPSFDLPTDMIEDLLALMEQLGALFPSGLFKALPDLAMKDVMDVVANILSQIAPFLSFYNFAMAALKMITCVIEVLCAIPNPFAMISKLKKLFMECIPPFIAMFPWMALLAMIISLLLLVLFLITYLMEKILAIIEDIIENINIFAEASGLKDADSTLAAAQKITGLLCMIQNLMAVFIAIAAIFAVIQSLAAFAGSAICDDSDEEGCCNDSICPQFIKTSTSGITTTGTMVYQTEINTGAAVVAALGVPGITAEMLNISSIRPERWQIFSTLATNTYEIKEIITPATGSPFFSGPIFYPEASFTKDTAPKQAPYTVDLRFQTDPQTWGFIDIFGLRYFQVKDCIVTIKPYVGYYSYNNIPILTPDTGTMRIEGGLVYEDDGVTPYMIGSTQATLNTFIHQPSTLTDYPLIDDSTYLNTEFTWKPVHACLASYNLITIGCIPEVGMEKAVQNATIIAEGIQSAFDKMKARLPQGSIPNGELVPSTGVFPNVLGAQQCVQSAIDTFRKNISAESAAVFHATVSICLTDLKTQTETSYCAALKAGISTLKSTATVSPIEEFTTRPIIVSVTLKDASGAVISNNIPADCADSLEELLKGELTFGEISSFEYDGSAYFTAEITSKESGSGILKIYFEDKPFSELIAGTVLGAASTIEEIELPYSFIASTSLPAVRRDNSDGALDD